MSSANPFSSPNKYVIDIEIAAETVRLIDQDKLVTQVMGGLFPEDPDLAHVDRIIDIGCGPGGWALEVALQHPDMEVVGVDINPTMIDYASAQAKVRQFPNAKFQVADVLQPLPFPDASFDLINARFVVGFMDKASWPQLLAECKRILRPAGFIRFTEYELAVSSSPALEQLLSYLYRTLAVQGRSFSHSGASIGIAHMLTKLLRDAGFEKIEKRPFLLESSYGTELHYSSAKGNELTFALLKPYLVKSGLVTEPIFDELYDRMLEEMSRDDFTSIAFGLTVWGVKP